MLFLSDRDIEKNLTMEETIETLEMAFKEYAKGNVVMPPRSTIMVEKYNGSTRSRIRHVYLVMQTHRTKKSSR